MKYELLQLSWEIFVAVCQAFGRKCFLLCYLCERGFDWLFIKPPTFPTHTHFPLSPPPNNNFRFFLSKWWWPLKIYESTRGLTCDQAFPLSEGKGEPDRRLPEDLLTCFHISCRLFTVHVLCSVHTFSYSPKFWFKNICPSTEWGELQRPRCYDFSVQSLFIKCWQNSLNSFHFICGRFVARSGSSRTSNIQTSVRNREEYALWQQDDVMCWIICVFVSLDVFIDLMKKCGGLQHL